MIACVVVDAGEEQGDVTLYAVPLRYGGQEGFCVEPVDVVEVAYVA